jgi:hypothetical protein
LSHSVLVVVVSEPALHLCGWHLEDFVSELAELFRERIDGEEVGTSLAAG